jgi:DNA-binding CsgD family transcriptional regulator
MNEVVGRAVIAVADNMRAAGVPTDLAMARIPVSQAALRDPACRVDWGPFTEFLEELEVACGGPEAFERTLMQVQPRLFAEFWPLFRFVLSPRDLFRLIHTLMRALYVPLEISEVDGADGRFVVTMEIKEPHRQCLALFRGSLGGMRTIPEVLGLPRAEVSAHLTPRRAVFTVALPESQTLGARVRRMSSSLLVKVAVAEVERSWLETRRRITELEATNARLTELAEQLEGEVELRSRAEVALRAVVTEFAGSVCAVSADGVVSALDDTARAALDREGAKLAGRVAQAAAGTSKDPVFTTRRLGPGEADGCIVLLRDAGSVFAARLERTGRTWRLSPRHVEIVALVVRGMSNKEIAARLGCAAHTVDHHVSEVLRRSAQESRSALVAAFWSDA